MPVAVIPARGGSKRVPRKNIRNFCGKPMISWCIETIHETGIFDKVIVSTDDEETADLATFYGAEVPFIRPKEFADDFALTKDVMKHCLKWLSENNLNFNEICCVYPASPLLTPKMLLDGYDLLRGNQQSRFVFPVVEFSHPIERAVLMNNCGLITESRPNFSNARTQDSKKYYHDAGQYYWGRQSSWTDDEPIIGKSSIGLPLDRYSVVDIDEENDLLLAEILFKYRKEMNTTA